MLFTDSHSTLPLDKSAYNDEELITIISQQIFAGNYTNYNLLMHTFSSPQFKKNSQTEYLLEKSINTLKAQCEQKSTEGCSHAMVLYGLLYHLGIGCPIDYPKAIHWLDMAIKFSNATAMNSRGYMHQHGQGGPVNFPKALRLYKDAIKLGHATAMNNRAYMHKHGQGGPVNFPKAIELYDDAIKLGHASAMNNRALMHEDGQGGPVNFPKAIELYEDAIKLGHAGAMYNRALMHEDGQGGPVNFPKAIELYEDAIKLGDADAMNNRALMHENGQGGPVHVPEAIRLYEDAIKLGHAGAMNNRALMYKKGQGGPVNIPEAIRLYEDAIKQGSTNAAYNLNNIEFDNNTAKLLFDLIWDELLTGKSFSKHTLDSLSQFCREELINRLKASPLGTSLTFLKQLKTNRQHPLTLILNGDQNESTEFKSLMADELSLRKMRMTFFRATPENDEHCPLNRLPIEIKIHLFSFVQPGLEEDEYPDYFLPSGP